MDGLIIHIADVAGRPTFAETFADSIEQWAVATVMKVPTEGEAQFSVRLHCCDNAGGTNLALFELAHCVARSEIDPHRASSAELDSVAREFAKILDLAAKLYDQRRQTE